MAADEKAQARGERVEGKIKKTAGDAVGNESLQAEGRAEETQGDVRKAKEAIKDVFKDK
ncbi:MULTISPECIES: CsbD family protein [unclassified Streptomyces]|uniref:CsbD family protein n=1 Tax=unclassified Streptomyces TaxID=2593676 RepID=UPI002E16027D|nr:CsbD family protein [Streptomyces sp. NBC_01197]WSS50152.1 CsbD family protein [Streptomyces sp. NBC_01180]